MSVSALKTSRLSSGQAPKWLVPVVALTALILGAAASALVGFSAGLWAVFTFIIFVIAGPVVIGAIEGARKGKDAFARFLVYGAFLLALIPLVSVLYVVIAKGAPGLNAHLLWRSMNGVTGVHDNAAAAGEGPVYGGIYHAIIGTLEVTLLATLISVPVGLLTAIYLVEYARGGMLAKQSPSSWTS